MIERVDLRQLPAQPWKNGAGLTREIAWGGADPADFDWRLSVAEVDRDAPFSAFPGVDRCIVLLSGAGMRLRSDDGRIDHPLVEPMAPFEFAGDVPLGATLCGGSCRDFNVMTRRGRLCSEVHCHRAQARVRPASIVFVLCVSGEWRVDSEPTHLCLEPSQGLLWRNPAAAIDLSPTHAGSSLLAVHLHNDIDSS